MDKIDKILNYICISNTKNFKCYDTLKKLLSENEQFKEIIFNGIETGNINGFPEELWIKLGNQNLRSPNVNSFIDVFKEGYNQGYCTVCSKQVSYSLESCYLCGGELPILKGTANCPEGNHTWIEYKEKIIDTTLMVIIDKNYKNQIGYIEENRFNPNYDSIYASTKEYTNDSSIKKR